MSDTVSFPELDRQHVELLPARTVLSMFSTVGEGVIPGGGSPLDVVKTVTGMGTGVEGSNGTGDTGPEGS